MTVILGANNDNDSALSFSYDAGDRVIAETTGGTVQPAVTLTHTFDALDRRISMSETATGTTQRVYDSDNRMLSLLSRSNDQIDFEYDGADRPLSTSLLGGVTTASSYEIATGRLQTMTITGARGVLESFDYAYDQTGRIDSIAEAVRTRIYAHSPVDRLTDVVASDDHDESYTYDAEGNRIGDTIDTARRTARIYTSAYPQVGSIAPRRACNKK